MTYIHYGSTTFNPVLFQPIKNILKHSVIGNKPVGGLWVSKINVEYGWKEWCIEAEYQYCDFNKYFKLKFYKKAKIFIIDTNEKYLQLPKIKCFDKEKIDFEKSSLLYDAIEVSKSCIEILNGWDCESTLILNKNSFYII